jgi:hypothetical protein
VETVLLATDSNKTWQLSIFMDIGATS